MLAEISDKMPSAAEALIFGAIGAGVVLGLTRVWWPLVVLGVPVVLCWDYVTLIQLTETGFGDLVLEELGVMWVVGQIVLFDAPFVVVACLTPRIRRGQVAHARRSRDECVVCGYSHGALPGGSKCPECGGGAEGGAERPD